MWQGNLARSESHVTRLNLTAIELSLRNVQTKFKEINKTLKEPRSPMTDEVLSNMLAGYRFIDNALADDLPILEMGYSDSLLELNKIVLFGENNNNRQQQASQVKATQDHFYQLSAQGGVGELIEWLALHEHKNVWWMAAGLYIQVISQPQLFIEGNHRTGALMMSYLLCKNGKPPFVLSVGNARSHFEPSSLAKDVHKHGFRSLVMIPKLKKRMARNFKESAVPHYINQV